MLVIGAGSGSAEGGVASGFAGSVAVGWVGGGKIVAGGLVRDKGAVLPTSPSGKKEGEGALLCAEAAHENALKRVKI